MMGEFVVSVSGISGSSFGCFCRPGARRGEAAWPRMTQLSLRGAERGSNLDPRSPPLRRIAPAGLRPARNDKWLELPGEGRPKMTETYENELRARFGLD